MINDLKVFPVNSTTDRLAAIENFIQGAGLLSATTLTVTPTPAGSTAYTYVVAAVQGNGLVPCAGVATSTGPATLSASAYNALSWTAVAGARGYKIYRSASSGTPNTLGLIATVGASVLTFNDTGLAGDASAVPTFNTTNLWLQRGMTEQLQVLSANGAITIAGGQVLVTKGTAAAITLQAPISGSPTKGGMDGVVLHVTDTTGAAHTVTTSTNAMGGSNLKATFGGTANNTLTLVAYNGIWYVRGLGGCTLAAS